MTRREESLRDRIALGWVAMLLIQALMLIAMILESVFMDNDFLSLKFDPGEGGLKMMVFIFALYALMPIYIHFAHDRKGRIWRWAAFALAILGLFFYLLHHIAHWYYGQRPDLPSHALDATIHLLGLWVIVSSFKWARFKAVPAEGATS
jgi:uncharacterized BrkB/YihY/UPF0761 family membrane protein